jgi:NO-binding membrane sensor protein with MHYT domain
VGLPTGVPESVYKVLACLRDQHDYRLVLLAVLICGLASYTAFHIYSSGGRAEGRSDSDGFF